MSLQSASTNPPPKSRSPKNRTLSLSPHDRTRLTPLLTHLGHHVPAPSTAFTNRVLLGDALAWMQQLPPGSIDLAVVDPPYNLTRTYGERKFQERDNDTYESWLASWLPLLKRLLKPNASAYFCGEWRSSHSWQRQLEKHFHLRNRITWEREKGRGATRNWKNASEDIWFCTVSNSYHFDLDAVKIRRRVIAPYRQDNQPKDWEQTKQGPFRMTHPSNLWTDLTVPFWSMPENTDHPTQKPEKLIAKLILASSPPGSVVFDPFLGSGTTAVVARKLGRQFLGIEQETEYALLTLKRLEAALQNPAIQGYQDGVFWERNSQPSQASSSPSRRKPARS